MARELQRELGAGRAPVTLENARNAVLFHLRRQGPDHFAQLPDCGEDLARRMARAARAARSVEEFIRDSRSRRVPEARVRRALLRSFLGLQERARPVPFLRVLAIGKNGRRLLRLMGERGTLPVLTKPAQVRRLGPECSMVFDEIVRTADLRCLAWPGCAPLPGGSEWKKSPVVLEKEDKSVVK